MMTVRGNCRLNQCSACRAVDGQPDCTHPSLRPADALRGLQIFHGLAF